MLVPKHHWLTLGFLSQQLQRSPKTIEAMLDEKGIAPEVKLNGIGYYDEAAYAVLADAFDAETRGNA